MSEVLYRKWRPRRLDEVVGQEPVTKTLRRAVSLQRVAHAYLFCGPRGTGKTSTARILAKAVSCLSPQDGEPDNECSICKSIDEGRALDLIEIDAASNRGIDDIRNLRDKINYVPSEARYKVYIIDEVHMLTEPAFNALLKTLEEPPAHAIFVLATTEVHKLPLTIISRCQRFDFRRIPVEGMVERLADICRAEDVEAEPSALTLISRAAGGSLRDAVNMLEQTIVSYGSPVSEERVRDLMDLGDSESALELAGHIVSRDVARGLEVINSVADQGSDIRQLHRGAVDHLRGMLLTKSGAEVSLGLTDDTVDKLRTLAEGTSMDHLVRALKAFAAIDLRRDSSSVLPLELAMVESSASEVREARREPQPEPPRPAPQARPPASPRSQRPESSGISPQPSRPPSEPSRSSVRPSPPPSEPRPAPAPAAGPVTVGPGPAAALDSQWASIIRALNRKGKKYNLSALLRSSSGRHIDDGVITIRFAHRSHMERMQEELDDPESRKIIKDAFAKSMGGTYDIETALAGADGGAPKRSAVQTSHLVRAAIGMGARVLSEKEDDLGKQEDDAAGAAAPKADDEDAGGA